jgi:cyanobactin maturation PatA/PatG family protease
MPDLITIPGIPELWTRTQGDTGIKIVILDGAADLERACFVGANITQFQPYWAEDIELNDEYFYYLKLATEFNQQQKAKKSDPDHNKDEAKKEREAFFADFPEQIHRRIDLSSHATHIASVMLGQHGSPVRGIAPHCTAINIPISFAGDDFISPINLTHAINEALKAGANIIHIAACQPTQTGISQDLFARAVKQCQDNNILIVAPGGNDKGECWCIPAILPGVLTVGAMRDDGQPFKFSNYGGDYQSKGVMANGENILGAQPGTDEPIREKGTSCAAPIVTGISALLMSIQLQRGEKPNAEAVRQAILNSAIPCDPEEVEELERCLMGKLNVPGAYELLVGEILTTVKASSITQTKISFPDNTVTPAEIARPEINSLADSGTVQPSNTTLAILTPSQPTEGITPSAASKLVYALGTIGYDFGSEARRDTFKQLMPAFEIDGTLIPVNPYDARQMVDYLSQNPSEAKALIWTLNQELTPIYALEPRQGFAADVYETLIMILAGQIEPEDSDDFVERVSIPAKTTDKTVQLFSGQEIPVITLINTRGMYGWTINNLVEAALQSVAPQAPQADEIAVRKALTSFVNKVYFEFQNLGQTSKDRALNFSVTNAFQAASSFAEAISRGMQLDTIEVEKSPFCRINSDCWDVILKFFDPENSRRAKKVYRFTVDVSDRLPVTLGEVRSWSVPK